MYQNGFKYNRQGREMFFGIVSVIVGMKKISRQTRFEMEVLNHVGA